MVIFLAGTVRNSDGIGLLRPLRFETSFMETEGSQRRPAAVGTGPHHQNPPVAERVIAQRGGGAAVVEEAFAVGLKALVEFGGLHLGRRGREPQSPELPGIRFQDGAEVQIVAEGVGAEEKLVPADLERDLLRRVHGVIDALLAAGFGKPRRIARSMALPQALPDC
jgi:hypothetical protein